MTNPINPIQRFGVSMVGPPFEWAWVDDNGEVHTQQFRARASMGFEDVIQYNAITTILTADATLAQGELRRDLTEIGRMATEGPSEEGVATGPISANDALKEVQRVAESASVGERRRWELVLEQTLMLVHQPQVEDLRNLLAKATPTDVRALRDHLEMVVIHRLDKDVEVVANVDPTSLPSPEGLPVSDGSGQDSESTESNSME